MSKLPVVEAYEKSFLKSKVPAFKIGDTVDVHISILEGGKERVQVYSGVVIARKGYGLSETFTVRRVSNGHAMEKVFLIHSPKVQKIEVKKRGVVRRAKLHYLRELSGKKARIKQRLGLSDKDLLEEETIVAPQEEKVEAAEEVKAEAAQDSEATQEDNA